MAGQEQGAQRRTNPMLGIWIAVIGLLLALILGWTMMRIGAGRLAAAAKIRSDAEGRLMVAVEFAASEAVNQAQEARLSMSQGNWGEAQRRLSRVTGLVTLMEQVAPQSKMASVAQLRERLGEVQRLVAEQSRDALGSLDALVTQLDELRGRQEQ